MRCGLSMVGLPGAPEGISFDDPTLAQMLKPLGYMTAQFGKNHFGDRNRHLPTVHGFDEFLGFLYHLNAMEEPEQPDYPPDMPEIFRPRGVLDCKATDREDPTDDPRFGEVGRQTIVDTGPLTRKRMETIENELLERSLDFMDRAHAAGKPFLLWHAPSRVHIWTRLSERWRDCTKYGVHADGMQELDWIVGELLNKLDELGIADNTVVIFTIDNGGEKLSFPDGATSPFRGEKGLGWEGGFRAPFLVRWPGRIAPGRVLNGIFSLEDVPPTLMAAVGVPNLRELCSRGWAIPGLREFRVHIDGYNQLPYLMGEVDSSPRKEFFYYGEKELYALRLGDWKIHFRIKEDWFGGEPEEPTVPQPINLRVDPFEDAMHSPGYQNYVGEKLWTMAPALAALALHQASFERFPPRVPTGFDHAAFIEELRARITASK